MYELMELQIIMQTEGLLTHLTGKWPLSTVYAVMLLQSIVTE
jgi:hypothetical protein